MRYFKTVMPALAALCLVSVPVHASDDNGSQSEQAGEQAAADQSMKERWNETMETLSAYTAEQRDQALESGRRTLDAMDKRIDSMEAWTSKHWDSLSAEARERRAQMLTKMREQRKKVAEWYGGMKHGSAETWESVKQGFIKSYDKLQNVYQDTVDSFGSEKEGDSASGEQ